MPTTVKLSSKNQIVVPKEARDKLHLSAGTELLVLCKKDRIVLIPRPSDFSSRMAGLHRDLWEGIDADAYIDEQRDSWTR